MLEIVSQSNVFYYKKLTKEILEDCINKVFKKPKTYPYYSIYTNLIGMISIELATLSGFYNIPKTFIYVPKKGPYDLVISLENKQSLIKLYYKNSKFYTKKGTELLFVSNSLGIDLFKKIKEYK